MELRNENGEVEVAGRAGEYSSYDNDIAFFHCVVHVECIRDKGLISLVIMLSYAGPRPLLHIKQVT